MPKALTQDEIESFRSAIVDAARQRFAGDGYTAVTMRGLAAELGCSPMTPYRYFDNKEEIYHAVRTDAFERFGEAIREAAEPHDDPLERLRAIGRRYVRFGLENPDDYRVMFQLVSVDTNAPVSTEKASISWKMLQGTVQAAIDAGQMEGDALQVAHHFWAAVHGLVTLQLAQRLVWGREGEELVDSIHEVMIRGHMPQGDSR